MCKLSILRLHYTGQMTLEQLSAAHECDAAAIVDAHEALPVDERAAIDAQWAALKFIDCGLAPPDDPIFSGGVQSFTVRRPKPKPTGTGLLVEDIDQFGAEAIAGFKKQDHGETLSGADVEAIRQQQPVSPKPEYLPPEEVIQAVMEGYGFSREKAIENLRKTGFF